MLAVAAERGLVLRPNIKTHKCVPIAVAQLRGALQLPSDGALPQGTCGCVSECERVRVCVCGCCVCDRASGHATPLCSATVCAYSFVSDSAYVHTHARTDAHIHEHTRAHRVSLGRLLGWTHARTRTHTHTRAHRSFRKTVCVCGVCVCVGGGGGGGCSLTVAVFCLPQ